MDMVWYLSLKNVRYNVTDRGQNVWIKYLNVFLDEFSRQKEPKMDDHIHHKHMVVHLYVCVDELSLDLYKKLAGKTVKEDIFCTCFREFCVTHWTGIRFIARMSLQVSHYSLPRLQRFKFSFTLVPITNIRFFPIANMWIQMKCQVIERFKPFIAKCVFKIPITSMREVFIGRWWI